MRDGICNRTFWAVVCLAAFGASAQETIQSNVTGTVTDGTGNPRPGAVVMLLNAGLVDTADENGAFALRGDVGVRLSKAQAAPASGLEIRGGRIWFTILSAKTVVRADFFDCGGRTLFSPPPEEYTRGTHSIPIYGRASSKGAASITLARITAGGEEKTLRFADLGVPQGPAAQTARGSRFLAKPLAVVDTLLVSDFGCLTSRTPLSDYSNAPRNVVLAKDGRTGNLILNDVVVIGPPAGRIPLSTDELYRAPGGDSGMTMSFFGKRTTEAPDMVDIDYVALTNPNGPLPHRIVYGREFLPINWALDSFTIVVSARGLDTINPYRVINVLYGADTSGDADTATLSLHPGDLHGLLSRCKAAVPGFDTVPVHDFLAQKGIDHYNDLLRLAYVNSSDVAYYRYLCVVFSTANACLELRRAFPRGLAKRGEEFGPATIAEDILKAMLKHVLKEIMRDVLAKKPASGMDALLCESADKTWDECKYEYIRYKQTPNGEVPPEALDKCMRICSWVTLGCFTNICMPMTLEEAEAMDVKLQLAAFDVKYFGGGTFGPGGVLTKRGR